MWTCFLLKKTTKSLVSQCRAPSVGPLDSFSHSALRQIGWEREEETILFWLPLQAALYSEVLLFNCHWQALWPSGSMLSIRWPNCPSTNISSELLDHVKSITAVLTAVSHACGSSIKVLELRLESGEKRQTPPAGEHDWPSLHQIHLTKRGVAGLACNHLFWKAFQFC